ncbi:MAG: phosphatidylglycerophosphatase A family protein [Gammaproteobacteria bacterium]
MIHPNWGFILSRPAYLLAFGFGAGLSPYAPGTVGTLVGFPLYLLLATFLSKPGVLTALVVLFALGVWWCDTTGKAVGVADYGGIVWDEIIAMALILCFTPAAPGWWITAFIVFRFFDIFKPWPIRVVDERMQNGFGVMLDDLLAAGFSIASILGAEALIRGV